jgi:thiamine biosynthesis protein ThiC
LEQDIHYVVKDGKIVFPHTLENPYKTKPYLSKVLKTIMDNAGVDFKLVDVEQDVEAPKAVEKPKVEAVPPLSYTADTKDQAEKARTLFQKEIGEVPTVVYDIEPVDINGERKYKLVVTGFQNTDQRAKLFAKKTTLKEEQDFEMRRMLVRAGIIK